MAMENKRIIQLNTERTTPASDDYVMVDSATAGTAKYLLPKITDAIDQEISDRTSADTTLQGNITAEATARAAADTAINGEITQLKEDLSETTDMMLNPSPVLGWEQGAFDKDYGTPTVATQNAIRCTSIIPNNVIKVSCSEDYKMNLWAWSGSTYIGHKSADGIFEKSSSYLFEKEIYLDWSTGYDYKLTFYNANNATPITPDKGANCITYVLTDETLTKENKIADAKKTGERLSSLETEVDKLLYYDNAIDLNTYQREYALISSTDGKWTNREAYNCRFVDVPQNATNVSITTNDSAASLVALLKTSDHVDYTLPNYATGGSRTVILAGQTQTFTIPDDCTSIWVWIGNNTTDNTPDSVVFKIKKDDGDTVYNYAETSENIAFVGDPITIFTNDDESSISGVDDGLINAVSVVKVTDSLYYMYYEAYATGETGYANARTCFAYSNDGEQFIKGFPSGITPPIAGTNMVMPKGTNHGLCVVMVPDSEYPYRMVGIVGTDPNRIAKLWKSADGINWSLVRQITNGYNDSFTSCIVRGNLLKIFLRTRNEFGREIGVITTDLDGNRHMQNWVCEISNMDVTRQLYQASASILDDKRELLIPTVYNPNDSSQDLYCYILDGKNCKRIDNFDNSAVMTADTKSIYFASGIVNIGTKTYAYYTERNTNHESTSETTASSIKRIEITDTTFQGVVIP